MESKLSVAVIVLGLPLLAVFHAQAAVRNLNFIPETQWYTELQVKGWNTGSADTVLLLDWKAGDPAPDSIALPASLNETFHLLILYKKPDGSSGSEEGEHSPNSGHTAIRRGVMNSNRLAKSLNGAYGFSVDGRAVRIPARLLRGVTPRPPVIQLTLPPPPLFP
jgi:hypothetical protein